MTVAPLDEVWVFSSQLDSERAGSFRQDRWCRIFLAAGARVSLFNVRGAFQLSEAEFDEEAQFAAYRAEVAARGKVVAGIRQGLAARVLRWLKHMLVAELYLPNIVELCARAIRRLHANRRVVIFASSPAFSVAFAGAVVKWWRPQQVILVID